MKKKQQLGIEQVENLVTAITQNDDDPDVVSYALYDFDKKAFISGINDDHALTFISYCGDIHKARLFDNKVEAFHARFFLGTSVGTISLIKNKLFGLTPKPGSLNETQYEFSEANDSSIDEK